MAYKNDGVLNWWDFKKVPKFSGPHLEDHPRYRKWLGSPPPFISPFGRGPTSLLRGRKLTIIINHLLNGMILQALHTKKFNPQDSVTWKFQNLRIPPKM